MSPRAPLKRVIKVAFLVLVTPLSVAYLLFRSVGKEDGMFQSFSQLISLIPGKTGVYVRAAFYRLVCTNTSDEISIGFLTVLSHRDTTIRPGVYIGPQCNIGKCTIEKNTLLGSGVHILSGNKQHDFSNPGEPIKQQGGHFEKITIGEDCWLGNNSVVMCSIPPNCVVAAGAVVHRQPQRGDIIGGNPGVVIKNRFTKNNPRERANQ